MEDLALDVADVTARDGQPLAGRSFHGPTNQEGAEMKSRWIIAFRVTAVLVVGLVVSSCTKQRPVPDVADSSDVYALISVDGQRVPADIVHEGVALQVRAGTFIIHADGTCSSKTVFVPPSGTEIAREVKATYTKDGSTLTMLWEGAGKTVGTIEGDIFTMDNEGMVFVYGK